MPSAFTHALIGAAAVQFVPREASRVRVGLFLAIAATVPDLDVVAFDLGIPYAHPLGHRGLSHSLLFALLLGLTAPLFVPGGVRSNRRVSLAVALTGVLVVASHGLLDAATDAGLGIGFFLPFSGRRFFFGFRPIETASVDPLRFFSRRGLEVLRSELVWVWLPLFAVSVVFQAGRLVRSGRIRRHG